MAGRARPGTVVIAMTDPPLLGVPALLVARLRGARCLNWLQDVFPEVAEGLDLLRSRVLDLCCYGPRAIGAFGMPTR